MSRRILQPLRALAARGVPVLLVQGTDNVGESFEQARAGVLGRLLVRRADVIEVVDLPDPLHGFRSIAAQEATVATILRWCSAHSGPSRPGAPRPGISVAAGGKTS